MFDALNTFWGGVVSLSGSLLTIYALWNVISSRQKLIAYDFRSQHKDKMRLPKGFDINITLGKKSFSSLYVVELIIKNESEAPLTDDSFVSAPEMNLKQGVIVDARKIQDIDDSRGSIGLNEEKGNALIISDLMVPIDSSITFEIFSDAPIDQEILLVHKNVRVKRRKYRSMKRHTAFYFFGPLITCVTLIFGSLLIKIFTGFDAAAGYSTFVKSITADLNLHVLFVPLLYLLFLPTLLVGAIFIYRWSLRATAAEKRFTETEIYGSNARSG